MKLIIVDDEKLIRQGLKIILAAYKDIEIVGLCENGSEAYTFCKEHEVDLVLMDVRMPECNGVVGTKLIKEYNPDIKVLILTTFKDTGYLQEALKNGASGYLLKDSSSELIYGGIKATMEGNVVVHPEVAKLLMQGNVEKHEDKDSKEIQECFNLTEREVQIIKEIANGLTNYEIGQKLFLTEGTIKNNITTILSKLELRDRTQIAIFAFKHNIVS